LRIKSIRRAVLSMLKGRAPEDKRIAVLCGAYSVLEEKRYSSLRPGQAIPNRMQTACILCSLCAEACARLGAGAISSVNRGILKKISTPYDEPSAGCIGCASCAAVCPTGAIECAEGKGIRAIWGKTFELAQCEKCVKSFATKEELAHRRASSMPKSANR